MLSIIQLKLLYHFKQAVNINDLSMLRAMAAKLRSITLKSIIVYFQIAGIRNKDYTVIN